MSFLKRLRRKKKQDNGKVDPAVWTHPFVLGNTVNGRRTINLSRDALVRLGVDVGSIRVPVTTTEWGAAFGEEIGDKDRECAADREPVGHFYVYYVAQDVFDNWFEVVDPSKKEKEKDVELNNKIQRILRRLKAKQVLRKALEGERLYGWSIVVGRFSDADASKHHPHLAERDPNAKLIEIVAYSKKKVTTVKYDKDPDSDRYGEPEEYWVDRGSGIKRLRIHYSRCIRIDTRDGKSAIDVLYDDLGTYRNERWGLGQTLFRYGSGFPELKLKGYNPDQLVSLKNEGIFDNLMSRSYLLSNENMDFSFKGASGVALNPDPFVRPIVESLSAGSRIPEAILRGANAGALTGSEVNQEDYFGGISSIQSDLDDSVRNLIKWAVIGEEELKDFKMDEHEINWLGGFEINERDKALIELSKENANKQRLSYMMIDEVRKLNELDPLPDGAGKICPGAVQRQPELPRIEGEIKGKKYVIYTDDLKPNHVLRNSRLNPDR